MLLYYSTCSAKKISLSLIHFKNISAVLMLDCWGRNGSSQHNLKIKRIPQKAFWHRILTFVKMDHFTYFHEQPDGIPIHWGQLQVSNKQGPLDDCKQLKVRTGLWWELKIRIKLRPHVHFNRPFSYLLSDYGINAQMVLFYDKSELNDDIDKRKFVIFTQVILLVQILITCNPRLFDVGRLYKSPTKMKR